MSSSNCRSRRNSQIDRLSTCSTSCKDTGLRSITLPGGTSFLTFMTQKYLRLLWLYCMKISGTNRRQAQDQVTGAYKTGTGQFVHNCRL